MIRRVLWTVVVLVVLAVVFYTVFAYSNRPVYRGSLELKHLGGQATAYFDENGVPHIYADREEDAYRVLGYLHAQDRLWQMELMRRIAAGRLSEILGPELVKTDKFFRGLGIERSSELNLKSKDTNSIPFKLSQAYLDGINQFIETGSTPIEFRLLGIDKEAYDLIDIYNVFGYMSFGFAQAHKTDPLLTDLKDKLSASHLADLDIEIDPKTTLIPNARPRGSLAKALLDPLEDILSPSPVPLFIGSNSWVIGPDKTKEKQVLFANDPHIGFSQPAVWYQAHIVTPDYEMYGFHLALCPFPLLGHNRDYAYGLTMLENDDMDFYYEADTIFDSREEVIKVKGEADVSFQIRTGDHGPVMNDLMETLEEDPAVSMSWYYTAQDNAMLEVSYQMSHASDLGEFKRGVAEIHAPGLNVMYGDAKGNIAWFGAAQLYSRPEGVHSKFILDGSQALNSEIELLDFDQNPQAVNPRWDYVYSANNQPGEVNGSLYPGYYLPEDRAKRIVGILDGKDDFTSDDVKAMIYDVTSSNAGALMDRVLNNMSMVKMDPLEREAIDSLRQWDGSMRSEQMQPTLYFTLVYHILKNTFRDEMGQEIFDQFMKTHLYKRQIARQINLPKSVWWDDVTTKEIKENREEIFTRSFHEAISILRSKYGDDLEDWSWRHSAHVIHKHAFDKSGLLRGFFNVGPFVTHGGNEVINNQLFQLDGSGSFEITAGPSTRRVIDFADIENGWAILPTGQSGNVFSKYYNDQARSYLDGEFTKMELNEERIRASEDALHFRPVTDKGSVDGDQVEDLPGG